MYCVYVCVYAYIKLWSLLSFVGHWTFEIYCIRRIYIYWYTPSNVLPLTLEYQAFNQQILSLPPLSPLVYTKWQIDAFCGNLSAEFLQIKLLGWKCSCGDTWLLCPHTGWNAKGQGIWREEVPGAPGARTSPRQGSLFWATSCSVSWASLGRKNPPSILKYTLLEISFNPSTHGFYCNQ